MWSHSIWLCFLIFGFYLPHSAKSTNWWNRCRIVNEEVDLALTDSNEVIRYENEGSLLVVQDEWAEFQDEVVRSPLGLVEIRLSALNGTTSALDTFSRVGTVTKCYDSNLNSTTGYFQFGNLSVNYGEGRVQFPLFAVSGRVECRFRPTVQLVVASGAEGCRLWGFQIESVDDVECSVSTTFSPLGQLATWVLKWTNKVPLVQLFLTAARKSVEKHFVAAWCSLNQ